MSETSKITVMGAGAWGTALALAALRAGAKTTLWARRAELAREMDDQRRNERYLPGIDLPTELRITHELESVLEADVLLLVTPAQSLRTTLSAMRPLLNSAQPLVLCAKGIEKGTGNLMGDIVEAVCPDQPWAVLSGPNFAKEVAQGLPAATTIAARDTQLAIRLVEALGSATFRPYSSNDPLGAQIGGAVKNVLAIACGIVVGRRLGENARAALVTRGLAEIMRLGRALGARRETLMGLSGLGDLTLTCSGTQSRNYSLGLALGEGRSLDEILSARNSVTEGVATAAAVADLAKSLEIDMPLCQAVNELIHGGKGLEETIQGLLSRPFRAEEE